MRSSHSDDELFLGILDAVGSMSLRTPSSRNSIKSPSLTPSACLSLTRSCRPLGVGVGGGYRKQRAW